MDLLPVAHAATSIIVKNPLGSASSLPELLVKIINLMTIFSTPVFGIMVVIGGIRIMISQGRPAELEAGQNTLKWGGIGFGIILLATSVGEVIKDIFGL